jgi:hypothetical protein
MRCAGVFFRECDTFFCFKTRGYRKRGDAVKIDKEIRRKEKKNLFFLWNNKKEEK